MAQDIQISGYPTSIGSKILEMVDHYGPASYQQSTGDVYPVTNINQGGFDKVAAGTSLSGTYNVIAVMGSSNAGIGVPTVTLRWYVISTGAQVGNGVPLSTEAVRLEIIAY